MSSSNMCHPFVEVVSRRRKVLSDVTAVSTADKKLNIKSMSLFTLSACFAWQPEKNALNAQQQVELYDNQSTET